VISRLIRRSSPFQGGQDHLSHRLIRAGVSRRTSVVVLWALTAAYAFCAAVIPSASKLGQEIVVISAFLTWALLFILFLRTSDS
jgi:UDP-GlcNAc:undecaprenyl-phosphate GlcNAc-1-phosphate transferase